MRQKRATRRSALLVTCLLVGSLLITLILYQANSQAAARNQFSHTINNAPMVAGTVTEFKIPTPKSEPVGITSGPDGNLWFTEAFGNNIGKITTGGVFLKEYALPHADSEPENIVAGPDGNLWFTKFNAVDGNRIGTITTTGVITEYPLPNADSEPEGITVGPDGNLWFTEFDGGRIGTITTSGQITEYSLPQAGIEPEGITSGPCDDGTQNQCLWFTEQQISDGLPTFANAIWRITTSGTLTEYALPQIERANDITLGANGVLYFTQEYNDDGDVNPSVQASIGEITYSNGRVQLSTLASLPNGGSLPDSIVEGSDGNLWFTEYYRLGMVTPQGQLTEYSLPAGSSNFLPDNITTGPDGNLWFTEYMGSRIGSITV